MAMHFVIQVIQVIHTSDSRKPGARVAGAPGLKVDYLVDFVMTV